MNDRLTRVLIAIGKAAVLVLALSALAAPVAGGQESPMPEDVSWIFQPPAEIDAWWNARGAVERMLILMGTLIVAQIGTWTRLIVVFVPLMILCSLGSVVMVIQTRNLWWLEPGGVALLVGLGAVVFRHTFMRRSGT